MTDRHETHRRLRARSRAWSAVAYLMLVGLPAVGVFVVLGAGRDLQAPPDLAGRWRVETGATCGLGPGSVFTLVQSGQFIQLEIADRPTLQGRLEGRTLRAAGGAREASAPGCTGRLNLRFRLAGAGDRLEGTGGIEDCSACPPRPVSAVRVRGR